MRWWERAAVALLGLVIVGLGSTASGSWWNVAVAVIGWSVVAAAIGVVELMMAAYYRLRRAK